MRGTMRKSRVGTMGLVGVAWLILVVLLLGLILVQAEGAPSVPTVTVSGTLTPSVVQTVQVSFTNTMYATQPVNSVLNFGTAVVYKAIVNNITVVAFNQKIATSAISSSGLLYTMQATASISIPQLCSGALCDGFIENLTVTAYSTASTWVGFWQSSSVTVSFLSSSPVVFNPAPHIAAAPIGAFLYETVGMATIFSAVVLIVIGLSGIKPDYMYVAGGLTVVVFILEVLVFLEGL